MRPSQSQVAEPLINAFTVDVEDWVQSVWDADLPLTDCFVGNTHGVLNLLDAHAVKATFFVLGMAAQKAPELVRELSARGHDVQSHGFGHRAIHLQTREEFRADIDRSKKLLEDIVGREITGYRAPRFSITQDTLWALDVLVESGFEYDSSVFPVRMRRYGIAKTPMIPHRMRTPAGYGIDEIPVASWSVGPLRIPIGGGGYFRLFPYRFIHSALHSLNACGVPAAIYCHPYEFSAAELAALHKTGAVPGGIPLRTRLHQGLGRKRFAIRVERMLRDFHFGSVTAMLKQWNALIAPRVSLAAGEKMAQGLVTARRPADDAAASRTETVALPAGPR